MQELFRRFQPLNKKYNFLKEQCEGNVISWKWAKNDLDDIRPLWYERNRWKPGTLLKFPPTRPMGIMNMDMTSRVNSLLQEIMSLQNPIGIGTTRLFTFTDKT